MSNFLAMEFFVSFLKIYRHFSRFSGNAANVNKQESTIFFKMLKILRSLSSKSLTQCQVRLLSSDISVISDEVPKEVQIPEKIPKEASFEVRNEFWQKYPPANPSSPRQAWVEDLNSDDSSSEIINLHPDVWSVRPRLDIIYDNVAWQINYKKVDWEYQKDRHEVELINTRRPWPQKGIFHKIMDHF